MKHLTSICALVLVTLAGCSHSLKFTGEPVGPDPHRPAIRVVDLGAGKSYAVVDQEPIVLSRAKIAADFERLKAEGTARKSDAKGIEVKLAWSVRAPGFRFNGKPGEPQKPNDPTAGIRIDTVNAATYFERGSVQTGTQVPPEKVFNECSVVEASIYSCWVSIQQPIKFSYTIQLVGSDGKPIVVDPTGMIL